MFKVKCTGRDGTIEQLGTYPDAISAANAADEAAIRQSSFNTRKSAKAFVHEVKSRSELVRYTVVAKDGMKKQSY